MCELYVGTRFEVGVQVRGVQNISMIIKKKKKMLNNFRVANVWQGKKKKIQIRIRYGGVGRSNSRRQGRAPQEF